MTRPLSKGLGVVGALACASIVAVTSHASAWAPMQTGLPDRLQVSVIVAACFASILAGSWIVSRTKGPESVSAFGRLLPAAIVLAAVTSLFAISRVDLYGPEAAGVAVERDEGPLGRLLRSDWVGPATRRDGGEVAQDRVGRPTGRAVWLVGALLLAALGLLGGILLVRRRSQGVEGSNPIDPRSEEQRRIEAHGAIVGAIDAMLSDADPRTAIIGAYARLLEELDIIGASRRAYEGPAEHLRRVLDALSVRRDPLETLVRLFTVARFSDHVLGPGDRDEALAALRDVAVELTRPAVTSPRPVSTAR